MAKQIEVAIAYTDHTWDTVFITIPESLHLGNAEEYAEEQALTKSFGGKAVAFVKVVWECPEEEDDG
jgi:hypothetical protein